MRVLFRKPVLFIFFAPTIITSMIFEYSLAGPSPFKPFAFYPFQVNYTVPTALTQGSTPGEGWLCSCRACSGETLPMSSKSLFSRYSVLKQHSSTLWVKVKLRQRILTWIYWLSAFLSSCEVFYRLLGRPGVPRGTPRGTRRRCRAFASGAAFR